MTIKVLIVDFDPEFVFRLTKAVASDDSLRLVASVSTGREGAELLKIQPPDILLIGTTLIDTPSLNVIRQAAQIKSRCSVMISTMFSDNLAVIDGIRAGATGYLLIDSSIEKLVNCIRDQALGRASITPWIARQVLAQTKLLTGQSNAFTHLTYKPNQSHDNKRSFLSSQENEVLKLIAAGNTKGHASTVLGISKDSVACAVKQIYEKFANSPVET